MRTNCILWVLSLHFLVQINLAQSHRIPLDTLATLDDPDVHLEVFTPTPSKPVKLPPTDFVGERFLKVFYSWSMTDDPNIVIMVRSKPGGDLLYIDKNADNDLTNDGPPMFFSLRQDTLTFDIAATSDPRQGVKLLLARNLNYRKTFRELPDSEKSKMIDKRGNLNRNFARLWGAFSHTPEFSGANGTFCFDDRVALRRGSMVINGTSHAIGLFDYDNNGLYNCNDDLLIVDVHGDGKLTYGDSSCVFKLNDVFSVAGHKFRIRGLDPYGSWVELEETTAERTRYFAEQQDSILIASAGTMQVTPRMWEMTAMTLDGSAVPLKIFRGKYLLLNFWGDWCMPCIQEIPALVHAAGRYPDSTLQFLSFVKVANIEKAKRIIADSGIDWPQFLLDRNVSEFFHVRTFPTNILILPNGESCIPAHTLSDKFFDTYVH